MNPLLLIAFGVMVGVFSGVMGLGGGSVMIPIMVLALGLSQPQAHGTSLAVMTVPVMLPAVIHYWRNNNVRLDVAAWLALGVVMGTFFGAYIANMLPKEMLKLVFGFGLVYVASYTIFSGAGALRGASLAAVVMLAAVAVFAVERLVTRAM